jgi:hypothetical protein
LHFEDEAAVLFDKRDLEPDIVAEFLGQFAQQKRLGDLPSIEQALRLARLTTRKDGQSNTNLMEALRYLNFVRMAEIDQPPFFMGQNLRDPKAQFDSKGLRQDEDILRGLTTFGAFQKPEQEIALVVMCPAAWASKLQAFITRLRQGSRRSRGIETTLECVLDRLQRSLQRFRSTNPK